jgi:hypothetical protein
MDEGKFPWSLLRILLLCNAMWLSDLQSLIGGNRYASVQMCWCMHNFAWNEQSTSIRDFKSETFDVCALDTRGILTASDQLVRIIPTMLSAGLIFYNFWEFLRGGC